MPLLHYDVSLARVCQHIVVSHRTLQTVATKLNRRQIICCFEFDAPYGLSNHSDFFFPCLPIANGIIELVTQRTLELLLQHFRNDPTRQKLAA